MKAENEGLKRRLAENVTPLTPTYSTPVNVPVKKMSTQMMPVSLSDTSDKKEHPFSLHFTCIPEADPDVPVANTKEQVLIF